MDSRWQYSSGWPIAKAGTICILAVLWVLMVSSADGEPIDLEVVSQGGLVRGEWELVVTTVGVINNVTFRIDDGPEGEMAHGGNGTYTAIVNTTGYIDGIHSVTVSAEGPDNTRDYAGVGLDVDNTPPTLMVKWDPVRNVTGDLALEVSLRDVHLEGSIVDLAVTTGQGRVFEVPSIGVLGEYRLVLDTLILENTTHAMYVTAIDRAGNINTSEVREFHVRNHPDLTLFWEFRQEEVVVSRTYDLSFQVRNRGTVAVDGFTIGYFRGENLIETIVYNETLEPGEMVWITLIWTPQTTGTNLWRAFVDYEDVVVELSEANNEVSLQIVIRSSERGDCGSAIFVIAVLLPSIVLTTTKNRSDKRQSR